MWRNMWRANVDVELTIITDGVVGVDIFYE